MAHNPILEKRTLGRSLFGGRLDLPVGAVGVLYDGGRYLRTLEPREKLTMGERSRPLLLYVVDVQPHRAVWNVRLPTADDQDQFPVSVVFEYEVADTQQMIQGRIQDTEVLLSRTLERPLRETASTFGLHKHRAAASALEEKVFTELGYRDLGLKLISADVTMNLDGAARERIRQLEDLERAVKVPQLSEHTAHLPSKEPAYGFDTRVAVTYRVVSSARLPTRTLGEAEEWLWRQVQRALRRESRHFTVDQETEAEEAMQAAIEIERFSDHGLEVVSALVEIDLDERASERALTLGDIRRREEFARAKADLEDWQKKRELDHQRDAISFYQPLIEQGQWSLLAMILSQDASSAEQILGYLDAQRRETLTNQMEFFTKIIDTGALEGWEMEEQAKVVLQSVLDQTLKPRVGLGLPEAAPLRRLKAAETGAEESKEESQEALEENEEELSDAISPASASETLSEGVRDDLPPGEKEQEGVVESQEDDAPEQDVED